MKTVRRYRLAFLSVVFGMATQVAQATELGGVYVSYAPERKKGWGGVELTIINSAGDLRK